MGTPTPYEVARQISAGFAPVIQNQADRMAIDQLLQQAKQTQTPLQNLDLISEAIKNVSPERRSDVVNYLTNRYNLSREQAGTEEFMRGGSPYAGEQGQPPQAQAQGAQMPVTGSPQLAAGAQPQVPIPTLPATPLRDIGMRPREIQDTPVDVEQRARELMAAYPMRYKNDPTKAIQAATNEQNMQSQRLGKMEAEFDKYLARALEKGDISKDIIGEMQNEYHLKAREDVIKNFNKSASAIAQEYTKNLVDFAKARTNVRTSKAPDFLGVSQKTAIDRINAARKEYKTQGRLDLFEDDLVNNVGLSTPVAAMIARPPADNNAIGRFINDTKKKLSLAEGSIWQQFTGIKGLQKHKGNAKRTEKDISNFILDNLKPDDSLLAIGAAFNALNYDSDKILSDIQAAWEKGDKSLSKSQQRDLQKRSTFGATLNDIMYFSGLGLNPGEIINE